MRFMLSVLALIALCVAVLMSATPAEARLREGECEGKTSHIISRQVNSTAHSMCQVYCGAHRCSCSILFFVQQ